MISRSIGWCPRFCGRSVRLLGSKKGYKCLKCGAFYMNKSVWLSQLRVVGLTTRMR